MCADEVLISACAVASGVAVEFIACRPARPVRGHLARRKSRGWGIGWAFRVVALAERQGAGIVEEEPVAGSGQGVSVMMRS